MVDSKKARTNIRLIDSEDASRTFRHLAPVGDCQFVEVCQVDMTRDEAWRTLRDNGYVRLEPDSNTIYVVTKCDGEEGAKTARYIAENLFGLASPRITLVHPASSQAGLAAATRR